MLEKKYFGFSIKLKDKEFWDEFSKIPDMMPLNIEYDLMMKLKNKFVGFTSEARGIYNYKIFECVTRMGTIDKVESFIDDEFNSGKKMILYYIDTQSFSNAPDQTKIRLAYVE